MMLLVFCGAAEEMLPKFLGAGFPMLLAATLALSVSPGVALAVVFAVAAGGFEDSLSHLPIFASASFFLVAALVVRRTGHPVVATAIAGPAYQVWLAVWMPNLGGGVFGRILTAVPLSLVAACVVGAAVAIARHKAALDEQG